MDASAPGMYDFSVLRGLRKREGLTIQEVSGRARVSPAVISKLERNRTLADLATLFKLGRVFGVTAADLLALAESRTAQRTSASRHVSGDFTFDAVRYSNVQCLHGQARKRGRVSRPEIHRDDYEVCWVLRGAVRIALPNERHVLKAGQAVQFDAVFEHTYQAIEDCEILILHLPKGKRF
jgi:transcriptional regulator with XRE-family HTH domain